MAFFPEADFEVQLAGGVLLAGATVSGELVVTTGKPIARAEHIECAVVSTAWATYGSGKNKQTIRRELFRRGMRLDVPGRELAAGRHRFPFTLDVPSWLPPPFSAMSCGVTHEVEARIDVDWAIDPSRKLYPAVVVPPRAAAREALATRSPPGFHESLVLEVTLSSRVLGAGEPLSGVIAMRGGGEGRFHRVELSYASLARIVMGRRDLRPVSPATVVVIPADSLRSGAGIPFSIPAPAGLLPTLRNAFIDHDAFLLVRAVVPWHSDPTFDVLLDVLPPGSTLHGEARLAQVGGERLRLLASSMAHGSGLREAPLPTLVEGTRGFVAVRLTDAPRAATLGIDVDFTFPDLGLGIEFRRRGILDGAAQWQVPAALGEYRLRSAPLDPSAQAFFDVLLAGISGVADVRLSDHHLGFHLLLANDDPARMLALARAAAERAAAIDAAIRQLPYAPDLGATRAAWEAAAVEQNALLVPSGPALHGIVVRARVLGGEERRMVAAVHTVRHGTAPHTCRVDLLLDGAALPAAGWPALESETELLGSEALRAVRAVFPFASVLSEGAAITLEGAAWPGDPRTVLPVLDTFLGWVLEARGERRADAPYR
ncbi:MAG: hypothetical protein JWP97_1883 [Labilithrix sp.]|nr:hypothetical protein [Labilithrix sp.]